jgi:hypothetical protein
MSCCECEQEIRNGLITVKDITALNKKLLGRQINRYFCESCLAEYLEIEINSLPEMVEDFKSQGCKLF